ncbi:amidase [Rubrivivax rivuli]|nr:amidase [Rubrivivax rivuli]
MTAPLHTLDATTLARALAARELKAETLAQALTERALALGPRLHAWAHLDAAAARRRARALDQAAAGGSASGALHGLPLGIKDNIDTAGLPTAYGSAVYAGHVPQADAAVVALARAAGAWVMGKTACTEFANMTPCATRNPHVPAHTPGGSSSGSAAAVAAGLVPLALGTQTAGSVIRPAAFCGTVGYKPSPRRLPRAGAKPNSDTLDEIGVLARSVADAALLSGVLGAWGAGPAPRLGGDAATPRLGVTLTSRAQALSAPMVAMVEDAAARLSAAGATMQLAVWPEGFDSLFDAQRTVQVFETAMALAAERQYRRRQLSAGLRALLDEGAALPAAAYAAALSTAQATGLRIEELFGQAEVLLTPAAPGAAPRSLRQTGDPAFNRPWQLLGCPCLTLPGGLDAQGLPLGLQLVARPGQDARLFEVAAWVEERLEARTITHAACGD